MRASGLQYLRSDSAGYTADVINTCKELGVTFTIAADQDAAVKTIIKQVSRQGGWIRLFVRTAKPTDREYKTAIHCMEKTASLHADHPALAESEAGPV